jgi:hypothetical protein
MQADRRRFQAMHRAKMAPGNYKKQDYNRKVFE